MINWLIRESFNLNTNYLSRFCIYVILYIQYSYLYHVGPHYLLNKEAYWEIVMVFANKAFFVFFQKIRFESVPSTCPKISNS